MKRLFPIGAEYSKHATSFRVWAPDRKKVHLFFDESKKSFPMDREPGGYFSLELEDDNVGKRYYFQLDDGEELYPDPASRCQPEGVDGPSEVVNPYFCWTDDQWAGLDLPGQIIYELHIGTFTQEGTFKAASERLEYLAELGITLIEIMPINEFPGNFGWGYDGVYFYAPYHLYGSPHDVKAFINKAHQLGIGVILDVVYNHFGPSGCYFSKFSKDYFNPQEHTEWGEALNFDHPSSREYFVNNARYWVEEFHFDGLRLDATPWIFCTTKPHVLEEIERTVREAKPKKKRILIAESETQDATLLQSYQKKGYAFDALWNDDFHHTALVRLKGKKEAYYSDYLGSPQEFISSLKYGFLYQGQYYDWQKKNRGKFDLTLPYSSKVVFLENHDQIANTANGKRVYEFCDYGNFKALSCLMLLGPNTPMLFQGQEYGSTSPFYYFADHEAHLNELVQRGREEFFSQFPSMSDKEANKILQNPSNPLTFIKSKLDFSEKDRHVEHYSLYKDLINLRKKDDVFQAMDRITIDGAVLSSDAFLIRYFGNECNDRLLLVNLGSDLNFNPAPEPLLVPGEGVRWEVIWSSESFVYGGVGTPPICDPYWKIPGRSAIVLKAVVMEEEK